QMPALPAERRRLLVDTHGLSMKDALQLSGGKGRYFDEMVTTWKAPPKPAANLVMGVLSTKLNELKTDDISQITVSPEQSARLLALVDAGTISATIAKDVWLKAFDSGRSPDEIVAAEGLTQIDDETQLASIIADVIARNADAVAKYRGGNAGTFGFLVGQVMKAASGKANPKRVNELLKRALGS